MKNIYTKKILIGDNVLPELENFVRENFQGKAGCIICDRNTRPIAVKYIAGLLSPDLINSVRIVCFEINSHHADEFMIETCEEKLNQVTRGSIDEYAYFIACGAGTIHDITRVTAHKHNKPFISFPTAASVDGFVSGIAPITSKSGMKLTLPSVAPVALFAEADVIADAPRRLAASGFSDLIGKYIALADWRIANLLIGEEIDEEIVKLVYEAVNKAVKLAEGGVWQNYKKFCAELLEGLVLSGLCMQSVGHSRPASGSEHHIAHLLEMNVLAGILGENECLHGENVATGTVLCAELYHKFASAQAVGFAENYAVDEELIKKYYGDLAGEIIKENLPLYLHKITPEIFCSHLDGIRAIIKDIPTAEQIIKILAQAGEDTVAVRKPSGESKELVLKLAPYVRNFLTLMKLCRCLEF